MALVNRISKSSETWLNFLSRIKLSPLKPSVNLRVSVQTFEKTESQMAKSKDWNLSTSQQSADMRVGIREACDMVSFWHRLCLALPQHD
jgi:hypothetical protein